jgi:hypothetical protein
MKIPHPTHPGDQRACSLFLEDQLVQSISRVVDLPTDDPNRRADVDCVSMATMNTSLLVIRSVAGSFIILLSTMTAVSITHADTFVPGCTVPFSSIATNAPIDSQCGKEGGAFGASDPDTPPHRAQNRAKNNLCATGAASRVTAVTMKQLQQVTNQMKAAHHGAPFAAPTACEV